MRYEEILKKLKEKKEQLEGGNAEFWEDDIESELDEKWAEVIRKKLEKK